MSRRENADGWNAIVLQMIKRGAKGSDDQFGEIVDYLSAHFPKKRKRRPRSRSILPQRRIWSRDWGFRKGRVSAIVRYREKEGPFKTFEDLAKVPGIDVSKLEAKKSRIDF